MTKKILQEKLDFKPWNRTQIRIRQYFENRIRIPAYFSVEKIRFVIYEKH